MTVFIHKGDKPLSVRQATNRGLKHVERELSEAGARPGDQEILRNVAHADLPARLQAVVAALGAATYAAYALAWETNNETNGTNNVFNHQLVAYRSAVDRLAQYELAVGRAAYQEGTGEFDVDGNEIMRDVPAIDPLPATVTVNVTDEEGNVTGTEEVPNPLIVQDAAERAAAQQVIDRTPQEVKDFAG